MVARVRMNGITTVHHDVRRGLPVVVGFVNSLLDESLEMGSAPTTPT
jgi:hypothetical protein